MPAPKTLPRIERALAKADPALGRLIKVIIERSGPRHVAPSPTPPFEALVRAVVYQSVSAKAAASIYARLKAEVGKPFSPGKIGAMSEASIAAAGLAKSKARAIANLAAWFLANRKRAKALPTLPDDEVVAALTSIPGVGPWTVNVFLIFNLGREDVMPASDLGIRRGVQLIARMRSIATPNQVKERALLWRPYRSVASLYLWTSIRLKLQQADLG
ncbi:DNA-3-methyladenine glycosylase II [Rhodoplanes sp. Z2-YC6860]|nr:DNA-3-methyladenine glycosylase II [Rhodoplanes sp. Z2-YC6860]